MTAVITTTTILDREDPPGDIVIIDNEVNYMVTLTATDRGVRELTSHCFFFVQVDDINDNNPVFDNDNNPIQGYMVRTATNPQRVLRLYATDVDLGQNAEVTYSFTDETECPGCFSLDTNTGWITRSTGPLPPAVSNISYITDVSDFPLHLS